MPKIEIAIREAIARGAGRQIRRVARPLRREVRRLRQIIGQLRQDMAALRQVATQWRRMVQTTPWKPQVSEEEVKAARLSPRLIQRLRARLGLSQKALSQLVGVSPAAVAQWERGGSVPSRQNRTTLVGLRKLGRRDVKDLLARTRRPAPARRLRVRRSRGGKGSRRTRKT